MASGTCAGAVMSGHRDISAAGTGDIFSSPSTRHPENPSARCLSGMQRSRL